MKPPSASRSAGEGWSARSDPLSFDVIVKRILRGPRGAVGGGHLINTKEKKKLRREDMSKGWRCLGSSAMICIRHGLSKIFVVQTK